MVYYRKYRPQTIDELDSEQLRNTLHSVFGSHANQDKKGQVTLGDIPHAFLFTGPKGLGKTSTARIVAKVVNCVELKIDGKKIVLCDNHCEPCKSIANGSNMDVLEIDGASNRGIDEIRDLREKVRLAPGTSHKKVYIIDEVHMLTTEAFNALLKTIEEPPSHVVFIFCTTEAHKVPGTIMSRCFNIALTRATTDELVHSFKRIAKGEKLTVEDKALEEIAQFADGSFRDGAKLLEELALASDGKPITTRLVEEKYHVSSISSHLTNMLDALAKKDTKGAMQLVSTLSEQGIETKYFIGKLLEALHLLVLINLGISQSHSEQQVGLSIGEIKQLVGLLSKAYSDTKLAALPQLPLELAIIEWTSQQTLVPTITAPKTAHQSIPVQQSNLEHTERIVLSGDPQKVDKLMDLLITKTKVLNQSLAGILRGCHIKQFDGNTLIIEAHYKFHKEKLDEQRAKEMLQKVSAEIAGKQVNVSILLSERS